MSKLLTNFLRHFKICLDQCTPNIFRVVSSVAKLSRRLRLNLTEHDINWIKNCQDNTTSGFYFKCHHGEVRLISCLPNSNKEIEGDFLIITGWFDAYSCYIVCMTHRMWLSLSMLASDIDFPVYATRIMCLNLDEPRLALVWTLYIRIKCETLPDFHRENVASSCHILIEKAWGE